jgi:hypothetical protein
VVTCLFFKSYSQQDLSLVSVGKQKRRTVDDYMKEPFAGYENELSALARVIDGLLQQPCNVPRLRIEELTEMDISQLENTSLDYSAQFAGTSLIPSLPPVEGLVLQQSEPPIPHHRYTPVEAEATRSPPTDETGSTIDAFEYLNPSYSTWDDDTQWPDSTLDTVAEGNETLSLALIDSDVLP